MKEARKDNEIEDVHMKRSTLESKLSNLNGQRDLRSTNKEASQKVRIGQNGANSTDDVFTIENSTKPGQNATNSHTDTQKTMETYRLHDG